MSQTIVQTIEHVTQEAYQCIEGFGLASTTLQDYWYYGVVPIRQYFSQHGCEKYSDEKMQECLACYAESYEFGGVHVRRYRKVRKVARIITDLQIKGKTAWKYCEPKNMSVLPEKLQEYLDGYLDLRIRSGSKEATVRRLRTALRHFLLYATSLGYSELLSFTEKDALDYIPVLSKSYQRIGDCLSLLRPFGKYLFSQGFIAIRLDSIFLVKDPVRRKCIEGFSESECTQIVQGIDRGEPCGKRDYAILMLAMHTGLRGVDVLGLRFQDVDWKRLEIRLVQSKTEKPLVLPIPVSVLNALADYILTSRPETVGEDSIFLRSRRPYQPMKTWSAWSLVKRNAAHVNILWTAADHKGFHSFRRSIASRMLENSIPLDTIKEILGHSGADSLKPYIAASREGLDSCAVDISSIPLGREELQ